MQISFRPKLNSFLMSLNYPPHTV